MSDEMDEVDSIAETLQGSGLQVYDEKAEKMRSVETEKATVREVADALEGISSECGQAFEHLSTVIEGLRKEIRQLQNHRHPKEEWYSGKPVL